jgi:hypothetical protein
VPGYLSVRSRPGIAWPAVAFFLAAIAVSAPILAHLHLPLVDLPNHLARLHIAAADPEGPLSVYYTYTAALVPNSAVDLAWRALGYPGTPERFSQLMMALGAVNLIASSMVLARVVHGRWTCWSVASALLVFNGPFLWGFQNFFVSLPFCLYGLALWLHLEERTRLRFILFVPFAIAIYLLHFFAFAILTVAILGREVQLLLASAGSLRHRVALLILRMAPFAIPVLWLALLLVTSGPSEAPSRTSYGPFHLRIDSILSPLGGYVIEQRPEFWLGLAAWLFLFISFATILRRQGTRLVLSSKLYGPVFALAMAALLAPEWLNGVAFVHIRVPTVLFAVLLAGTTWVDLSGRNLMLLAAMVAFLMVGRSVAFERSAAQYTAEVADLIEVAEGLPAGARLISVRQAELEGDWRRGHMPSLLVGERSIFVPTLFQGVHAVRVLAPWQSHSHPAFHAPDIRRLENPDGFPTDLPFVRDWQYKFTHLLFMDTMNETSIGLPHLTPLDRRGRFTLFGVDPT